jgi:uncharacterized protein
MEAAELARWEGRFAARLGELAGGDAAHDAEHVRRVVANAKRLAAAEGARLEIVLPAAWLHDGVYVAKDDPLRAQASRLAAAAARAWLGEQGYPGPFLDAIAHAIEAHSFTAAIPPETLEARVVQDADRLDALGAVGLARCLALSGQWGRPLYQPEDPFCRERPPDERAWGIDHLFTKLLRLESTLQTAAGRAEGHRRTVFLRAFLEQLACELAFELPPTLEPRR